MNEQKLVQLEELTVVGVSVRTCNQDEFDPNRAKLGAFWQRFRSENLPAQLPAVPNSAVYGVYSDYGADASGYYTVTAGMVADCSTQVGSDFTQVKIGAGQYLVFSGKGSMPEVVITLWQQVWEYFSKKGPYTRRYSTDFELYLSAEEVDIYIAVSS